MADARSAEERSPSPAWTPSLMPHSASNVSDNGNQARSRTPNEKPGFGSQGAALAWSLIFGLFASTVFTLFVIPVVYWLLNANKPGHGMPLASSMPNVRHTMR
jgi:hypothetical protein